MPNTRQSESLVCTTLSLPLPEASVPIYCAGTVTSTFSVAWRLVDEGLLPPWGSILAERQSAGRGQMRRTWESPPGNLYVTFRLPGDPELLSGPASLIVGYLLAAALKNLGFSLQLKWPNDLLNTADEKVGGILLEERDGVLLAGVGINLIRSPDPERLRQDAATPAGTLFSDEKNMPPAPFFLWRSLVGRVVVEYTQTVARRDFVTVREKLAPFLAWKGQRVILADSDGSRVQGRYESLSPDGGLALRLTDGTVQTFYSGSLFRAVPL